MESQVNKLMMGLVAYAAQRDILPRTLCDLSNTSLSELQNSHTPLSQKQVDALWHNAVQLTGDALLGLHFGEALQLSALGVVGEIIKSSETVGNALTTAASLVPLTTVDFTLEVLNDDDQFTVKFIPRNDDWQTSLTCTQMLDLLMVFVIHELDGLLLKKIKPTTVNLARSIKNISEYERVMRCRPATGNAVNAIVFDISYWNEPIITANYALQKVMLEKVSALQTVTGKKEALQTRIYNYLLTNAYLGIIPLENIASNFNTTARTLQRKLKQEGSSFQQLAEDARKTLAIRYLQSGSYPVKAVSYMLGYNELSAFSRAFKRWTGISPADYQKQGN